MIQAQYALQLLSCAKMFGAPVACELRVRSSRCVQQARIKGSETWESIVCLAYVTFAGRAPMHLPSMAPSLKRAARKSVVTLIK